MLIRPSLKFIKLSYVLCLLVAVALGVYILTLQQEDRQPWEWAFLIPAVWFFFTLFRHMQRRLEKIILSGDRLRYEAGLFSKATRTVELDKVQDIRVNQTLWQRMVSIGDISLETAGGHSSIAMASIDNPQSVADHILELARASRANPQPPAAQTGSAANPQS